MAPPAAAAAGEEGEEEDILEVRCAGCGETLEVERGLTEFICPDCSTAQALPPELMPPRPPRRRRALPIPPARLARLPCGACGALLSVPPGLARCGCPACGAELAVDAARLSTAAAPLVPVSLPPVFQAREVHIEYDDSAVHVGHIQGDPKNQLVHVEQSQGRCQNTQALSEYSDADIDSDDICTERPNESYVMHHHRSGSLVAAKTIDAKRRQAEALNHVTCQAQMHQFNYMVHAKYPGHTIHIGEAQDESLNHAIQTDLGHVELIKEKTIVRHSNQVVGTSIGPKSVSVQKRQVQTSNQIARVVQKQPSGSTACAEYATVPYPDQVIDLQEAQIDPVNHTGNPQIQLTDRISARDCNRRTRYSVSHESISEKERQFEVANNATKVSKQQKGTISAEQIVSEAQEHTPAVDGTLTEQMETDFRKQFPRRMQKRKKLVTLASNIGQQLRRSKRLAPDSNAVVNTGPSQTCPPHNCASSPYQLEMAQLQSNELPASNSYLESHNRVMIEPDMDQERAEVEPHLFSHGQGKTGCPKLLSPIDQESEHPDDNRNNRHLMSSSDKGSRHRRSKRLTKQSAATTFCKSPQREYEKNQAASPSRTISDSVDIERIGNDTSSCSLPPHDAPQRSCTETENILIHQRSCALTTESTSISNMCDPESFARYYSKIYPPEVRRALSIRNPNLWPEPHMRQSPSCSLHAGGKEIKRCRGPTLCLKVWTMPEGVRIPVSLDDMGQPIGNEAATLSSFLGILARDGTLAPLTFTDWRYFPHKNKDVMWHLVKLKFAIAPIAQAWVMKALGTKWKHWKVVLKHNRYDIHETDEERLADRDSRVPEEQWKLLVAYWGTEKAKAASARSRASLAQQPRLRHRSGTKSYARIREEERQKRPNREEPSDTDMFILTHTPKDGKGRPIDKATADVIKSRLGEEAQQEARRLDN